MSYKLILCLACFTSSLSANQRDIISEAPSPIKLSPSINVTTQDSPIANFEIPSKINPSSHRRFNDLEIDLIELMNLENTNSQMELQKVIDSITTKVEQKSCRVRKTLEADNGKFYAQKLFNDVLSKNFIDVVLNLKSYYVKPNTFCVDNIFDSLIKKGNSF